MLVVWPVSLLLPACTNDGWDPTTNMGRADGRDVEKYVFRGEGTFDISVVPALSKYIRGQRRLNRSEQQILTSLAQREIGGYRFERIKVLEQKRAATTKRHQTQRSQRESRYQTQLHQIQRSPAPAPEKARQLESATREHTMETTRVDAEMKRELVLIDTAIEQERRKTYVVPVSDPKGMKNRSVVLIDANNRVRESKVYQIDRSIVDLAKVVARDEPEVAVLSDVPPLRLPGEL